MHRFVANYASFFVLKIGSTYVPQAALKLLGSSKSLCLPRSQETSHMLTDLADRAVLCKGLSLFPSLLL